jgi:Pvc16 N-terminal domain/Carboxypeptidase regulatory-like domain
VIRDLSKTLEKVLKDPAQMPANPDLNLAVVVFDRPSEPFAPPNTTVDLFLYDVRENTELRSNEPVIERVNGQAITHPPPLRLACSYLVTAWPVGGQDLVLQEHRLLGQVLRVLSRYPTIPQGFLVGSLIGQQPPLPMVALHPDALKNVPEFWTSIGNKLKPSLTLTATISVPVFRDESDFLMTTQITRFALGEGPPSEEWVRIGGLVRDLVGGGISGARVDVLDAGLSTKADASGRYQFDRVPVGTRTLRVSAVGFQPTTAQRIVPGPSENYNVSLTPL